MIESEIIVYSFIAAGLFSLICFGIFIWMNMKDKSKDETIYRKKIDPRSLVDKYKHVGAPLDKEPDPISTLKKYLIKESEEDTVSLSKSGVQRAVEEFEDSKKKEETKEQIKDDSRFAPPHLKKTETEN